MKKLNWLCALVLVGLGFSSAGIPVVYGAPQAQLRGTFIQYQSWMMDQLNAKDWETELNYMKKAGIETIVIQWNQLDSTRFFPVNAPGTDPTEEILSFADKNNQKVFLGLKFDQTWWHQWGNRFFLEEDARENFDFVDMLWKRYHKHSSLAGWYIPDEMSDADFDANQIRYLRGFLHKIALHCKKISGNSLLVSFSTFFTGKIGAEYVEKIYQQILENSGIDILIVQDGVGANRWQDNIKDSVEPYLKAFKEAADANGIETWAAVESFKSEDNERGEAIRYPTEISSLKEQIATAAPWVSKIITFDFFHYMSPQRGLTAKTLYDQYLDWVSQ